MAQASCAYSTPAPAAPLPSYPWPRWMPAPTPKELDDLIEGLIEFRDRMDADSDLEADADAEMTAREWHGEGAHRYDVGLAA